MQYQQSHYLINKKVIKKGLILSLIIGSILNAINQGDHILANNWNKVSFLKLSLTYITPFLVSVYSTVTALRGK